MKFAVVRFPGSNCDQDCVRALRSFEGVEADYVWHKESRIGDVDAVVLPGGFSYGDYLRCGAIARFSPVMNAVIGFARHGGPVIGICNGFQILCEAGLLPGALVRNRSLHFVCRHVSVRVEHPASPWTRAARTAAVLNIPVAHGEGCYFADADTIAALHASDSILLRYCDATGRIDPAANPNGSINNIAGICNPARNVFGLMPHPERACDPALGSTDGRLIFESLLHA